MTQDGIRELKRLVAAAAALPEGERAQFIENQHAPEELKAEALRLLAAREQAPEWLMEPGLGILAEPGAEGPEVGEVLGERYQIESLVGEGGRSRVYLARDRRMGGNPVAVKVLHGGGGELEARREAVRREIAALARVRHPGVSGLIDEGVWGSVHPYVVMQYRPGRTLREMLRAGPVAEAVVVPVLRQVAEILEAAHEAGVLHLDLKPENIVVADRPGREPIVSVVDFGIAEIDGAGDRLRGWTPQYRAPELAGGTPTAASDLYALARVARELLPRATGAVRVALERGAAREPGRRPASAREFADEVVRALNRGGRIGRRAALAALACGAAALVAWTVWFRPPAAMELELKPLTRMKGIEYEPAFSPDGRRLYFSHGPMQTDLRAIYYIEEGSATPVRFSFGGRDDSKPTVSDDSKRVAFARQHPNGIAEVMVQDAGGGNARVVYTGFVQGMGFGKGDHLYIASLESDNAAPRMKRLDLATGHVLDLPPPPAGSRGDIDVEVSPDGRMIAWSRYRTSECADLYIAELREDGGLAGQPRRLTTLDRRIFHPSWLPGGKGLLFVAGTLTQRNLWRTDMNGRAEMLGAFGGGVQQATVSSKTGRVAVVVNKEDGDLWKFPLDGSGQAERLYSSTSLDEEPRYSRDGRFVAFISERSGALQAWVGNSDGSGVRPATNFKNGEKLWVAWSGNNDLIIFVRNPGMGPELHRMRVGIDGEAKRVFAAPPQVRVVGVSRDGAAVYVDGGDDKTPRLERWTIGSQSRETVAAVNAAYVIESEDGGWVYFSKRLASEGLFRVRRAGGEVERVAKKLRRRTSFAVRGDEVYFVAPEPRLGVYVRSMRDGTTRLLFEHERAHGWGLDISPDGRELLVALVEHDDADIYVGEMVP